MGKYSTAFFAIPVRKNHHRKNKGTNRSKFTYIDITKVSKRRLLLWHAVMSTQPSLPKDWYEKLDEEYKQREKDTIEHGIQFVHNPAFDNIIAVGQV